MVTILPPREKSPSFGQKLSAGVGTGLQMGTQMFQEHQQKQAIQNLMGAQGQDVANLPPELQQLAFQSKLRQDEMTKKLQGESEVEGRDYSIIENTFGKNFADIWKASPIGGRTELLKNAIEATQRGINIEEMLGGLKSESPSPMEESIERVPTKTMDFDKGLTPKERTRRQEARYTTNLPLYQQSIQKRESYETLEDELGALSNLSSQIGGLERLNINPRSGELIIPALASPEAQRYVKTINDLTRTAKETYGSRVTNFDLAQFLKRLPTLANSQEGREQILKQLEILNKINLLNQKNLQEVIEDHGGIRNIDFDKAEELARKKSDREITKLKQEFKALDNTMKKEEQSKLREMKSIVPKDHVAVRRADGTTGYIPKNKLKDFLKISGNEAL